MKLPPEMSKVFYKHHNLLDNSMHKAAFRGKVDQINFLLNDTSPYKTTSEADTPLHLSLSKGHQDATNIFLDILETDVTAGKTFLKECSIPAGAENENFAVAIGKRQIGMVFQNCSGMFVNRESEATFDRCSFILIKETIQSVPNVLIVRPNNQAEKLVILSTVFDLLNDNGVVSLNVQRVSDGSTVLHLAAAGGNTEVVMRMLDLGANPFVKDKSGQTAIGAAHAMGEFPTYVAMCRRLNLNMLETKDFVRLPINNAEWDKVEFMIETLVTLRVETLQENRDGAITAVLSMNELAGTFLLSNVGEKCMEKYGQYLPAKKLAAIIMLLVNNANSARRLGDFEGFLRPEVIKEKTNRVIQYRTHNTLLHTFVRNGCNEAVRKIYQDFPELKTLLFQHKDLGLSALIHCIQSNHIDLAQYLIAVHNHEIDHPKKWSELLIAAAELPESMEFMKMILEHRMTDPNLILTDPSRPANALFACIAKGNLEKLRVLLESDKLTNLNMIRTRHETLLQSAICSVSMPTPPSNRIDSGGEFKYLWNDLDSSEEEDEPLQLDQVMANDANETAKCAAMNEIFDLLIEKGANYRHTDSLYQTLLNRAVDRNNAYVVERLLNLGLDPIEADGCSSLHYVKGIEVFNILQNHPKFGEMVTARNKLGATVLHSVFRNIDISLELCSKIIATGIDVNAVDNVGFNPLHYAVRNPSIPHCQLLINGNANINRKNSEGYTAPYYAIYHGNYNIAALLFRQPSFDLFALDNNGQSYLTILASCQGNIDEMKSALETRKDDVNRLVGLHCNQVDNEGFSHFYRAATANNQYVLELLMAQPHVELKLEADKDKSNDLLLHRVGNNVKFAKFLVDKGLDVNKVDAFNKTPLMQALSASHGANVDVVRCLIESGANVNYTTWQGTSALHVACTHFHLESIQILLRAGADVNARERDGKMPYDWLPVEYRNILSNLK